MGCDDRQVRRIAIVGPVAAGKSTLARHLGARLALPVVELDDVRWRSGRRFSDAEWAATHHQLLQPECWIIAGDHRAVAAERFAAADTIVWLDLGRAICCGGPFVVEARCLVAHA